MLTAKRLGFRPPPSSRLFGRKNGISQKDLGKVLASRNELAALYGLIPLLEGQRAFCVPGMSTEPMG
jgi:hypothetical protein